MKKITVAAVFLAVFAAFSPLFAQEISEDKKSEYYYVNVAAEKVYPSNAGYVIVYRKGVNEMAQVYLPNEWFYGAASKGELITLPPGKNWPSLTVYYKNGEFSHVRLFVHRSKAHPTWGNVPTDVDIKDRFEGVESVNFEF